MKKIIEIISHFHMIPLEMRLITICLSLLVTSSQSIFATESNKNSSANEDVELVFQENIGYDFVFNPNHEKKIFFSKQGQTLVIFNERGRILKHLSGHDTPIVGMVFNPTGSILATIDQSGRVITWNEFGEKKNNIDTQCRFTNGIVFVNDNILIVNCHLQKSEVIDGRENALQYWNIISNKIIKYHTFDQQVDLMDLSPNRDRLLLRAASRSSSGLTTRIFSMDSFGGNEIFYDMIYHPTKCKFINDKLDFVCIDGELERQGLIIHDVQNANTKRFYSMAPSEFYQKKYSQYSNLVVKEDYSYFGLVQSEIDRSIPVRINHENVQILLFDENIELRKTIKNQGSFYFIPGKNEILSGTSRINYHTGKERPFIINLLKDHGIALSYSGKLIIGPKELLFMTPSFGITSFDNLGNSKFRYIEQMGQYSLIYDNKREIFASIIGKDIIFLDNSGKLINAFKGKFRLITDLKFIGSDTLAISGQLSTLKPPYIQGESNSLCLLDIRNVMDEQMNGDEKFNCFKHEGKVNASPSGKYFATIEQIPAQWNKETLFVRDQSGAVMHTLSIKNETHSTPIVKSVLFIDDSNLLISANESIYKYKDANLTWVKKIDFDLRNIGQLVENRYMAICNSNSLCVFNEDGNLVNRKKYLVSISDYVVSEKNIFLSINSAIIMLEKDLNEIAEFRLYFENYLHQFKMTDKSHGFINAGNYYKLDAAIVNAIVFRKGLKAYSFEQFDLRYNRPDIVLERINPDIKERSPELQSKIERIRMAWKKRVRENGFTPEQLTGKTPMHAPEINNIKAAMDETKWYNASIYSDSTRGEKLEDLPAETDKPKLKLQFSIKDEEGENCSGNNGQQKICDIIGYRVFVNGVPLHGETLQRFKKPAATQDVNEEVTLSAIGYDPNHEGENKIELSGFTEDGAESFREPVYITYHPPTPVKPRLFIAAFGINDYNGNKDFRNLHYAVKDAREFVDTFSKNNSGYEGEPLIFRGGAVTNNDVNVKSMDELKTFLKSANENDTVLVYFSGHGLSKSVMRNDLNQIVDETKSNGARLFKDHEYYFITKDADLNNLEKNAIKIDSIRHALASSSSRQKMLFLDTCQSYFDDKSGGKGLENDDGKEIVVKMKNGGKMKFRDSRSPKGFSASLKESELLVDLGSMFPELRRGTGTIEVSAAINGQAAQEGYELKDGTKIENGVFTYVLKEAIVKAKDEKGHISAQNLRRYVLEMVQEMTTDENGNVHQSPMVSRDIAGRDFMVVR